MKQQILFCLFLLAPFWLMAQDTFLRRQNHFMPIVENSNGVMNRFGSSIAVDGDYAVVGAPVHPGESFTQVGRAFVYRRNGFQWTHIATLKPQEESAFLRFGTSVAISGNTIAVGSPNALNPFSEVNSGAVYIFMSTAFGWPETENFRFFPFSGAFGDQFATNLVIGNVNGQVAVFASAHMAPANIDEETTLAAQGKVYEFRLPINEYITASTERRTWQSPPFRNGNTQGALFGRSIAIHGNILAVGATAEATAEDDGPINTGAVYLFDTANPEQQPFILDAPTREPNAQFGFGIALESNRMLVSSLGEQSNAGAAYYYTREEDGPWQLRTRFAADKQQINGNFGHFVLLTPKRAVISAPRMGHTFGEQLVENAGITYVFDLERNNFTAHTTPGEADQLLFDNFAWPNVNKSSFFGINGAYHPASSSLLITSLLGGDSNNDGGLHVFQPAFPPTFNGFGESFQNLSLIPGAPFSLSIPENTFAITNGNQLHYTVTMSKEGAEGESNWLRFSPDNLTFSGTPGTSDRGNYTVQVVTQTDQVGPTTTGTFSLSVINRAPVRTRTIAAQEVEANNPLTFSIDIFSDADEDPLTYEFLSVDLNDDEDGVRELVAVIQSNGTPGLPNWLSFNPENLTVSGTPALDDLGTTRLRIVASDGNGGQVSFSFEIRVILPNNAPVVNQTIPTQAAFIGQPFTFTFDEDVFFDLDGDDLQYTLTYNGDGTMPSWLNFDPWSRRFLGTPTIGTGKMDYPFLLTASDGRASVSTPLIINIPNRPPILKKPIPNLRLMVSTAFVSLIDFNNYFTELDGDGMTLAISRQDGGNLPNWLMLSNNTLVAAGAEDAGAFGVVITATDNTGLSTSITFQLSVTATNINPRGNSEVALQNFTVRAGDGFSYSLPLDAFIDDDGDELTYSFRFMNQFGSFIQQPWWMDVNPTVPSVSGSPNAGSRGTYTVLVEASDGLGSTSRSFVVTVANSAPQVVETLPNYRSINGFPFTLTNLLGYFDDLDGDMLSIALNFPDIECAEANCAPSWAGINPNWNYELIMRPDNPSLIGQTFRVEIIASDGQATATLPFNFTVIASNVSPSLTNFIVGDEERLFRVKAGETFNFTVPANTFVDADGDELFYSAPGRPSWLDFDPTTRTFNGIPEANQRGGYSIVVVASDGNADASTDFEIHVGNNAPVVANPISTQNASVGQFFRFTIPANTFVDPDGDGLEIYAHDSPVQPDSEEGLSLPVWMRYNERTRVMSGTPGLSHRGTYPITLFAFDQFDGAVVSHTFNVVVPNLAPVAAQGLVTSLGGRADEPFSFTFSEGVFSDPEGDAITLSATNLPAWLSFNANTLTLSGTPGRADVGSRTINLVATDALQGITSVNITILVEAPLSAADEQLRAATTVFPNPANGPVNLEMNHAYRGNVEIRLMEMSGKVIKTVTLEKQQQIFSHQLNTRELPAGIFLLQVMTREAAATHRLVIVE